MLLHKCLCQLQKQRGPLGNRQGKDGTAVTASITTKGPPVPAVGQLCTTRQRQKSDLFLPRDTQKNLASSYLWPFGEEGEGNQCSGGTFSSYSCTTGILNSVA